MGSASASPSLRAGGSLLLVLAGCFADGTGTGSGPAEPRCPRGGVCPDASAIPGPIALEEVTLEPSSVAFDLVEGDTGDQRFVAYGRYADGSRAAISNATFRVDDATLASIDAATGELVARGRAGGVATVTASALDPASSSRLEATARVEVTVRLVRYGAGADATSADRITALTAAIDPEFMADVVYPLAGAVMPQNVFPADLQWLKGDPGDVFRASLHKTHALVDAYLVHTGADFGNHWVVEADAWRTLAETDPEEDTAIVVDRLHAASGRLITSPAVTFRFARASLRGSVYYWDIEAGRIIRINDGTATRESFMPSPPVGCIGCHVVSHSGRYMAGRLGASENIGAVFDLSQDLTTDPPPSMFALRAEAPTSARWWFATFSPDDSRLLVSTDEFGARALALVDPMTGAQVPTTGALPVNATHPAWAPDGTAIAYVTNVNSWGGGFTAGDIAVLPVTGPDAFGAPSLIHGGANPGGRPAGTADSYPTWTPDSIWIVFGNGTGCRSENQHGALYAMRRDGSLVIRLDRASTPTGDGEFQPRFSPFEEGGYFWLAFLSRRDYGNGQVGTRGAVRQQIWVTAIRAGADGSTDPSEVAYWLPGQNPASRNISAYWAPRACTADGAVCGVGTECCSGDCRVDPGNPDSRSCYSDPSATCGAVGDPCSGSADCCGSLACNGGVCASPLQ